MASPLVGQSGNGSLSRYLSTTLLISLILAAIALFSALPPTPQLHTLKPQPNVVLSKVRAERSEIYRDIIESANATRLQRRDQYACKKDTLYKQDACCGSFDADGNGECGLGPTWCGADCDSKCDARAEW